MNAHFVATALLALAVGGCATDARMRQVAGMSAGMVNMFKRETQRFVANMNDLNAGDAARLQRLAAQAQALEIKSASTATGWEAVGDDDASVMYNALTRSKPGEVLAGSAVLRATMPQADLAPITADVKPFDSLVQKLNALAAEPTYPQLLQSWLTFGKHVNEALSADMKAAADALKSTPNAAVPK